MDAEVVELWRLRAECRGMDPDLFFPESNEGIGTLRDICGRCPVRTDCLDHAIAGDESGWWGGTSERERREIRAARIREARDIEMGITRPARQEGPLWDEFAAEVAMLLTRAIDSMIRTPAHVARYLVRREIARRAAGVPEQVELSETERRARIAREHAEIRAGRWIA